MTSDRIVTQHLEIEEARVREINRWRAAFVLALIVGLLGVMGWRVASAAQRTAEGNAEVAHAGVELADQLASICANRDPDVQAYVKRNNLCAKAKVVSSMAPRIDATGSAPMPVQTLFVPGPTATVTATSTLWSMTALPHLPATTQTATVTRDVPGPVTTVTLAPRTPVRNLPAPTVTVTDVQVQPAVEVTDTVVLPPETSTVTVTATTTTTATTTVTAPPVTETVTAPPVTSTVTEPGPTVTVTETATPAPVAAPTDATPLP